MLYAAQTTAGNSQKMKNGDVLHLIILMMILKSLGSEQTAPF